MSEEEALTAARARIDDVRARIDRVDDTVLDLIFREARSHNWWTDRDVSDDQLREIRDVMKYGTSWKSNFLCNIGYADLSGIKGPRLYRYVFDEVCKVI